MSPGRRSSSGAASSRSAPVTPLPAQARGLPLHPGDPCVFRIYLPSLGVGTIRVMFWRSPHAVVNAFHLDLGFAPLSFDKQPATRNPRNWVSSALGAVAPQAGSLLGAPAVSWGSCPQQARNSAGRWWKLTADPGSDSAAFAEDIAALRRAVIAAAQPLGLVP